MSAHTPGPWKYGELSGDVMTADGDTICSLPTLEAETSAEQEALANARLIATAPELLKALQFCVQAIRTSGLEGVPGGLCAQAASEARAVIAKARGGK